MVEEAAGRKHLGTADSEVGSAPREALSMERLTRERQVRGSDGLSERQESLGKAGATGPRAVPHFVPALHQEPSHLVAMGKASKSPVLGRKINTIANRRTLCEILAPQLLTEGLLVPI
jgi:hypothetical protein